MLLRSITKHVKDQNWFAVFLDFFIVVAGILIAFQITEWNEAQSDARRFDQQLISFQEELETNLEILGRYNERTERQINEINELRSMLRGDLLTINPERFNSIMFYTMAVPNYRSINAAFNDLAESSGLREISGTPLRQAILNYEIHTSRLQRSDRDALNFRDQIFQPFVNSELSYSAMATGGETEFGQLMKSYGFAPSPFISDISKAARSQELDNHLAWTFAIEVEKRETTIKLQEAIEELNAHLNEAR